jgi:hypothetical protein
MACDLWFYVCFEVYITRNRGCKGCVCLSRGRVNSLRWSLPLFHGADGFALHGRGNTCLPGNSVEIELAQGWSCQLRMRSATGFL